MEGIAEEVQAMQIPKERQPVDTETAANTWKVIASVSFYSELLQYLFDY